MAKSIRDYLGLDKSGEPFKPEHRDYSLDDMLPKNPTQYCPRCDSRSVKDITGRHNVDSQDYECNSCKLTYSINFE